MAVSHTQNLFDVEFLTVGGSLVCRLRLGMATGTELKLCLEYVI